MLLTAQQLFKDLEAASYRSLYLIVGEEPFQWTEILERFKKKILQGDATDFQFESWDGEGLDGGSLKASLEELPGLFADGYKLVVCRNFEKANAASVLVMESYFENPVESSIFLVSAAKADKRKNWYKLFEKNGAVIEINEPHDREWPKWQGYLEKKVGKRIAPDAWERLVASSQKRLSVLWSELVKVATFVGDNPQITGADVTLLACGEAGEDIFAFAEDVLLRRSEGAFRRYHNLVREGESEIKMLAILIRQFRIVEQYQALTSSGLTDPKLIGPQIGVHPYFVTKIVNQSKKHTNESLRGALERLADSDFRLKTGGGGLFENFLLPYFHASHG